LFEDVVFSIGGSAGVVFPFNGSYIRLNNLFFIGGDTLRGFAVGGVGPRDANTTDSIGGQYYYTGTTELSYPLPLIPKEVGLLGKAFVDVGSLWGVQGQSYGLASVLTSQLMRVSTGVGVQWISPFGPIRIDYAIPIQYESWDKQQAIRFSFGTRF
jgi:outer membrane protein insertion porin family